MEVLPIERPLRLLILSSELPPAGYGSAAALGQFLRAVAQHTDWRVDVVSPSTVRPDPRPDWRGVRVHLTSGCERADGVCHRKLYLARYPADAIARAVRQDLVASLVLSWQALPAGLAGHWLAKRLNVPHVVRLHGPELIARRGLPGVVLPRVLRRVLEEADGVVVKSAQELDALRAIGYRERSSLIPNVASLRFPSPIERSRANRDPARLLVVSRLVPHKSVQIALDALLLLRTLSPGRFTLTIAGDGPLRDVLRERAAADELPVTFLGRVPSDRMAALYAGHDLLVHPSERESSCNAVLEAMSAGLAVVGRASALQDIVLDRRNGILLDDMSALELASVLAEGQWRMLPLRAQERCAERSSRDLVEDYRALFAGLSGQG